MPMPTPVIERGDLLHFKMRTPCPFPPLSEMLYKNDLSNPRYTAHSSTKDYSEESRNSTVESPASSSSVKSYPFPPVKSGRKHKSADMWE